MVGFITGWYFVFFAKYKFCESLSFPIEKYKQITPARISMHPSFFFFFFFMFLAPSKETTFESATRRLR